MDYDIVHTIYCLIFVVKTFTVSWIYTFIPDKMFAVTSFHKVLQYLCAKISKKTFAVAKQSAISMKVFTANNK